MRAHSNKQLRPCPSLVRLPPHMRAARRTARWIQRIIRRRQEADKNSQVRMHLRALHRCPVLLCPLLCRQAEADFLSACVRLDMHDKLMGGWSAQKVEGCVLLLGRGWRLQRSPSLQVSCRHCRLIRWHASSTKDPARKQHDYVPGEISPTFLYHCCCV